MYIHIFSFHHYFFVLYICIYIVVIVLLRLGKTVECRLNRDLPKHPQKECMATQWLYLCFPSRMPSLPARILSSSYIIIHYHYHYHYHYHCHYHHHHHHHHYYSLTWHIDIVDKDGSANLQVQLNLVFSKERTELLAAGPSLEAIGIECGRMITFAEVAASLPHKLALRVRPPLQIFLAHASGRYLSNSAWETLRDENAFVLPSEEMTGMYSLPYHRWCYEGFSLGKVEFVTHERETLIETEPILDLDEPVRPRYVSREKRITEVEINQARKENYQVKLNWELQYGKPRW